MKTCILIVEDEPEIREMIAFSLKKADFSVLEAESAHAAEKAIASQIPDLILLDWMLPKISGLKFVGFLKEQPLTRDIPIIMLTAKASEEDKIKGLEMGADDYVTKPFSPKELIARIKTVLRRGPLSTPEGIINLQNIQLNTQAHSLTINKAPVKLSRNEYRLFHFLLSHPDRVYTREQLLSYIWGGDADVDDRTVDVQVLRLRKTLAKHGYETLIQTVHGTGYKLVKPK